MSMVHLLWTRPLHRLLGVNLNLSRSRSCAAWFSDANMQRSEWHLTGEMTLWWHCLIHPMWGQTIVWRGWESFTIAAAAFIGGFLSGSVLTIASPVVYTTGPASRHSSRVVVAYQDIWNQETYCARPCHRFRRGWILSWERFKTLLMLFGGWSDVSAWHNSSRVQQQTWRPLTSNIYSEIFLHFYSDF